MMNLTIGKVAKKANVSIETIRYYEKRHLIPEPMRNRSGYRQYPSETVSRIQFIKRAKELGFSLNEINELLSLRINPDTSCRDVRERAEKKIKSIQVKIETLLTMKGALENLVVQCKDKGSSKDCPILDALDNKGKGR